MMNEITTAKACWATALPAWMRACGYTSGALPKRPLRQFREWCDSQGFGDVDAGFELAAALRECAEAIAWAGLDTPRVEALASDDDLRALRMDYRAARRAEQAERSQAFERRLQSYRADQQTSCVLIAGESSAVLARGTFAACEDALTSRLHLAQPYREGNLCEGAWVIARESDGLELDSGWFGAHGSWWR